MKTRRQWVILLDLVKMFIDSGELGEYDIDYFKITLHDVPNTQQYFVNLDERILQHTSKYKIVILDKDAEFTNVNILDIEL